MALDYNTHSYWLSSGTTKCGDQTEAETWNKYVAPDDSTFFYIGGDTSYSYSNSYNSTVTGIYGKTSADAYFVDTGSGSVSTISVSSKRVQPTDPDDTDCNNCSNAQVIRLLRAMKTNVQLNNGAYIFRLYNTEQKASASGKYVDIPVYLDSFETSYSMDAPNTLNISLRLIRRSPVKGLNIGVTSD